MRWDGGGDDGADDGDGIDDDPDDARRDGNDDGGYSPPPPSGREIPRQFSPCWSSSSLCLVFASWRRRKNYSSMPPDVFRSKGSSTPKGSRRGPQGPGAGPTHGQGWTRGSRPPLLPGARLRPPLLPRARLHPPFWQCDLFPKIISSQFF